MKIIKALAALVIALCLSAPAQAQTPPVVSSLTFALSSITTTPWLSLGGQNSCTVVFASNSTSSGASITVQGASDAPSAGTKTPVTVTTIGTSGVITPSANTAVGGAVVPLAQTFIRLNQTAISTGSTIGSLTCSTASVVSTNNVKLSPASPQTGFISITGNISASGATLSGLTATQNVCTDSSKNLVTSGCPAPLGVVTSVTGGTGITVTGTTAPSVALTVPVGTVNGGTGATSYTTTRCVRTSSATTFASAPGDCATIGNNKTTLVIERFVPGTLTVAASNAFPLPSTATAFTVAAVSFQCLTAGSGTSTVQWQSTTTGDPTTASWSSITGATQSWTTAGGVVPATFTAVNLTTSSITWVRANITAVGGTAPQNCFFYLHGTQTIQ